MSADTDQQADKRARQKARRAERLAEEQARTRRDSRQRVLLSIVIGAVVVALGVLLVTRAISGTDVTLGVDPATVEGAALPAPPVEGTDAALGATAPTVAGSTPDGGSVTIGEDAGTAQAVVFMAHWCPHCQEEAPLIADWVDEGLLAEGVELVAVTTRHDPARPNWPPDAWLEDVAFPGEVLVDGDDAVATAWGLGGTPMWVFTDAEGTVVARFSGQIDADTFAAASLAAATGETPAG